MMTGLAQLQAEIQVRTTAQHIWAEASQTLQYKNEKAVPQMLKRAIYRVSALLETVDLEFERVLVERENYKAVVALTTPPKETLNVNTLEQVLDETWPAANKGDDEDYADLLSDLSAFDITTPEALRPLISKWRETALAEDAAQVQRLRKHPEQDPNPNPKRLAAGVFFVHCGLTRVGWISSGRNAGRIT